MAPIKHGMERSPEYRAWINLRQRCQNPRHQSYPSYGARGIKVCAQWSDADSFPRFYSDVGPRPSHRHSIERLDNDGDYEPGNCIWATRLEQANNTRNNRIFKYLGKDMTITQAIVAAGSIASKALVLTRINNWGWHIRRAVETPPSMKRALKKSAAGRAEWDWRSQLTRDESLIISASDKAMDDIDRARDAYTKKFGRDRMMIVNRAIQRAKHSYKKG